MMKKSFASYYLLVCYSFIIAGMVGLLLHTITPNHSELQTYKPTPWRRLNSEGKSQQYVKLNALSISGRIDELLTHYNL